MEQAIQYFEQMKNLQAQGVPLDWASIAQNMATMIKQQQSVTAMLE
jgi:hypothetical protein